MSEELRGLSPLEKSDTLPQLGSSAMTRNDKDIAQMHLPVCPIPRPGEQIVWYNDSLRVEGTLQGHGPKGTPSVVNDFGNHSTLSSFELVRALHPNNRRGPAWDHLPAHAKVLIPTDAEQSSFNELLSQRTPPGPRYSELVEEIWARGFEVFLVGGTVRDVLAGIKTNDVDLVTTMPLNLAIPLLEAMYRKRPSVDAENGFVRLGGRPSSGDPFIDLKMFCQFSPGTANAVFGADFTRDTEHRDFSCNAVYYDPVNKAYIDPCGTGISDAETKILRLVCNAALRSAFHQAQIVIRFFKFRARGFNADPATEDTIRSQFLPALAGMHASSRITYVRAQLLSKTPRGGHVQVLESLKVEMTAFGADREWAQLFEPLRDAMLSNRGN
jgi:hypothetical protein